MRPLQCILFLCTAWLSSNKHSDFRVRSQIQLHFFYVHITSDPPRPFGLHTIKLKAICERSLSADLMVIKRVDGDCVRGGDWWGE